MEAVIGQDLTEFFDDWLFNQGYPSYILQWHQPNPTQVQIQLNQTQSHSSVSFFEAPVPLRIIGTNNETLDVVLNNTSNGEVFIEAVTFDVSSILFDPEFDLISKDNIVLSGIDALNLDLSVLVYPNPAQTEFYIQKPSELSISKIQIFDILGRIVKEKTYQNNINIETLSTGLHFIKIVTNIGIIHKTLLKQ